MITVLYGSLWCCNDYEVIDFYYFEIVLTEAISLVLSLLRFPLNIRIKKSLFKKNKSNCRWSMVILPGIRI